LGNVLTATTGERQQEPDSIIRFCRPKRPITMRKIAVGRQFKVKDGKVQRVTVFRSVSAAIAAKKSKKQRVIRRTV
jgi:hypothetical protein